MGEITRRDAMKAALKAGAYAAPVILGSTHVSAANALSGGPTADIALSQTGAVQGSNGTGIATFTVTATNNGPNAATGVVVSDPAPVTYLSTYVGTPSVGTTYDGTTGVWTIGNLAVGGTATLTFVGNINSIGGPVTNMATRTASSPPDPNPINDITRLTLMPPTVT